MGTKSFRNLHDFVRHGVQIEVVCRSPCQHKGVVDAYATATWFRLHGWPSSLDPGPGQHPTHHFRCTRCGNRAGRLRPTPEPVTVLDFFPVNEAGWKALVRRLRD